MPPRIISVPAGSTPVQYVNGGLDTITPEVISATWNGASAAVKFLPCVSFYSQDGKLLGRFFPTEGVTAGDTAEVSYFPFRSGASSSGGSGIQFDTDPQTGDWLTIATTGFDPITGNGIDIDVEGGNDFVIHKDDNAAFIVDLNSGAGEFVYRYNRLFGALTTSEGFDFSPGSAAIKTVDITLTFLDSSDAATLTFPIGGSFIVRQPGDQFFAVDDSGAVSTVDVRNGQFQVQTKFPHSTFFKVRDNAGTKTIDATTDTTTINLKASGQLIVKDSGGNKIFEVDENGDLHGKTGKSLVFDL